MTTITLEQTVLQLPLKERAALAHLLLKSLDEVSEEESDELWLNETERRAAEIDAGLVQLIPSDVVSHKARELLQ